MENVRSFLFSILCSLFLVRPKMTGEVRDRRQKVVVVGGGVTGSLLTRELSSKLNHKEHELLLIEAKPHAIWLIAGARLVTGRGHHPALEERALVPYDKLFHNGNGSVKQGKVVSVRPFSRHAHTNTRGDGGEGDTSDAPAGPEKPTDEDSCSGHVVLEDGEKVPYDALILATGSKYSGPVDFPDDPAQCLAHIERWRTNFGEAKDIMLVGGGGVAIELAGELKDYYPDKKVVIVHGRNLLLNDQFPDKFRKLVNQKLEARGVELVLGDYVATFPENGGGDVVFRSGNKLQADLVVPTYGPKPNTAWISDALGPASLSPGGFVKMRSTLQLESHSSIWAVGDILDFPEGKRAVKANGQFSVLIPNLLAFLRDRNATLTKTYTPSPENIVLTSGAGGGIGYLGQLWGLIITSDWIIKHWLAKHLMVERFRSMMGSP